MSAVTGLEWQRDAACTGSWALFFPPEFERPAELAARETRAKAVCARCPVTVPCLSLGLSQPERSGIWAGVDFDGGQRTCRNGLHLMVAANTYTDPGGGKNCRSCRNDSDQRSRARQNEEAA